MPNYVPARVAKTKLGVSLKTLLRWDQAGKIATIRTPNGQRRYDLESILGSQSTKPVILYARVSSHAQRPDLERQIQFLRTHYPAAELIQEVGSGLNFRRKKFLALLERILSGDVGMVVVCHKDRLVRFGFELIQWICTRQKCELVVLNQTHLSPEREMVEDILAIIHVFSCRLYGLRKYKQEIRQELQSVPHGTEPRTGVSTAEVGQA